MFKKTLIAAAIATVAAAPAMADVSISGNVKYKITDTKNTSGDWTGALDNNLNFKASEDLGNGMSAFAQISLDTDSGSDSKDEKVGLSGSFGTVVAGRMEFLFESAVSSKMDVTGLESVSLTANDRVNAIGYVSPTVNGLHVAMAGNQNGDTTGLMDHKEILVAYDNGPLSVIASHADVRDTNTRETLYVSYKMGDLSVAAMTTEKDFDAAATADITDNMFRLDYTMGNNSITLGTKDSDTSGEDRDIIKLVHKLSSRTSVYAEHANIESGSDTTTLGMNHSF